MVSRNKPHLKWKVPKNVFNLCDDRTKDISELDFSRECLLDDWEPIVHDWNYEFQRNPSPPPPPSGYGLMATVNGTIQLHLRQGVR